MLPEPYMIQKEAAANFTTFVTAAANEDVALVACKDAKGREFQTLCIVAQTMDEDYVYLPFALMITPSLYPLMGKVKPPDNLKGEWIWDDDDDPPT